uniref:Methyltransferase like 27 n=1 Tax=Strix occidentalis caurina TaxID=311401 RepID=A0A8D0FKQ7_STROC
LQQQRGGTGPGHARVAAVHGGATLPERLRLYDGWAAGYEQVPGPGKPGGAGPGPGPLRSPGPADRRAAARRGLWHRARSLHRRGFRCLHGVDGSAGMLERARSTGLYRQLRRCVLGQEPLPAPAEHYDAVTVVGALGEGQVPSAAVPELLRVTKPGGFLCLTTRSNPSNLRYKAELEAALERLEGQGAWRKVLAQEVERWERATSEEESTQGTGYISGVVYIYQKCPVPPVKEG